ncbi:UbiD family decarboxylase [Phosphitispora fastidiosa]|uniref:UbiD family decarboxylase n=1 Tax=Phosphitispora fastidiosa TaxID=2837202 RepID=UPI001E55B60E|nr:UbiD family decarboxylase [Phosphitispora fastidiosa]MBU7007081.1 hypothetical protein [Phosphitispora fastidiosa]
MSLKEDILACLQIQDKNKRQISIAGIITKSLEPLGIIPVVVGGAAVEFYTLGQYATMDIDFVGTINNEMKEVMASLGFEREGRYWRIPGTDIMVEFPSDKLVGSMDKVQPVEHNGQQAYYIGIDDLILNRVQEAKHWNDMGSKEWARTLMVAHYDDIDWSYCHKNASKFGCRDKLEEIQKEAKKIKRQMDEK